ncbi:hypothetical protein INR49_010134 [Caranx melampygus]|nr:hypothetical protein INR49_010134 [Caranx melampygus]
MFLQLISSVDPKFLKLTKLDDKIYSSFRETFKELDIKLLKADDLKSEQAKETWRPFCNQFEGQVEDFNYGTLLRLDCEKDYNRGEHDICHQSSVLRHRDRSKQRRFQ